MHFIITMIVTIHITIMYSFSLSRSDVVEDYYVILLETLCRYKLFSQLSNHVQSLYE